MSPAAAPAGGVDVALRLVAEGDVPRLTELVVADAAFLAPWEPERGPDHATEEGQRRLVEMALAQHAAGTHWPAVVLLDGAVVGRLTVSDVVRGPFLSGHLGYWVSEHVGGRGVGTAAVAQAVALALGPMGLHRLQAATLPSNERSRAVLRRNGFEEIGYAPRYLRIAGRWQDHVLHQRLADDG
ncbi:GNAT family N-acetyltransferase [uncultured Pseudokineococcus sp.]|uniref:GNAT family N-acetyltransferase n=1 Tax=uncultured Pseudokineococcus sp. TaxID=1642928 RepID=UPI0026040EAE|nr:GNAT family N-acetyltransferase [uncultured Pseudokineococcus sp.]